MILSVFFLIDRFLAKSLQLWRILTNFANANIKGDTDMARPIRETPVLKGEDAFNFEWRRLTVDHMSKEQRAENRRKLEEQVARAKKYINICF